MGNSCMDSCQVLLNTYQRNSDIKEDSDNP